MDITRKEQRILHLLAQGGWIEHSREHTSKITMVRCRSRDGWIYSDFDIDMFRRLKRLRAISSSKGQPYRITSRGLELVRSQLDNQ